jgi:glutamate:Na+ symporter, ESS family
VEWSYDQGVTTCRLDLVFTLALAALCLYFGSRLIANMPILRRTSIPVPAIGGLLFALAALLLRKQVAFSIDTALRAPLQVAFFTTIGFGATVALLRAGGKAMLLFWAIATGTGIVQNIAGAVVATLLGTPPLLGVICGAVTLTGGPATGLAFTETFEKLGIPGAGSIIIAAATFGIFIASLIGNPVACILISRFRLRADTMVRPSKTAIPPPHVPSLSGSPALLRNLMLLLGVMGFGSAIGAVVQRAGYILPAFIFPMIVAAAVRLLDDRRKWFRIDGAVMEAIGFLCLTFFLVIALMDLKLWQLAGLAVPMLVILVTQTVLTSLYAVATTFLMMGRDYEAAVSTSGHIGFGMGITPNAMANMQALVERFGPAPRSFLVVPVVGAFFIDLSNSLVITLFANFLR